MTTWFERFVRRIVDAQMARESVKEQLAKDADTLRRELHNIDRGIGAFLVRGNGAASRGAFTTPEDLEDMRSAMKVERVAEKAAIRKKGRQPEPA